MLSLYYNLEKEKSKYVLQHFSVYFSVLGWEGNDSDV